MNEFENELKKQPLRRVPGHWRAQILGEVGSRARAPSQVTPWWTALLWPSPKAWGALAAAWALMIGFNILTREPSASEPMPHTLQVRMAMEEKRRLQAEIEEASVQRESPKPRTEITRYARPA
jgi:hypothetical protein